MFFDQLKLVYEEAIFKHSLSTFDFKMSKRKVFVKTLNEKCKAHRVMKVTWKRGDQMQDLI